MILEDKITPKIGSKTLSQIATILPMGFKNPTLTYLHVRNATLKPLRCKLLYHMFSILP